MIGNPHALGLVSHGILAGSTIGLVSKGYLVKIFETIYIPPDDDKKRTTGPGMRGFRDEEDKKLKEVTITVYAYGEKFVSTHIVDMNTKISIEDVEVIESGEGIVEVSIRNIEKDVL